MTALNAGHLAVWAWGICRNIAQLDVGARLEIPHTATACHLADSAPMKILDTVWRLRNEFCGGAVVFLGEW